MRATIEGLRLEKPEGLINILLQSGKPNVNIVYMQSEDAAVEWNMNHEDVYRNNCYIYQLLLSTREKNTFLILVLFLASQIFFDKMLLFPSYLFCASALCF